MSKNQGSSGKVKAVESEFPNLPAAAKRIIAIDRYLSENKVLSLDDAKKELECRKRMVNNLLKKKGIA